MSVRRQVFDWKARDCAEIGPPYDLPFAVKEFIQNCSGQILKDLQVREWNDWKHSDLLKASTEYRVAAKKKLQIRFPGLLTGPHGTAIERTAAWQLVYSLQAEIPVAEIKRQNPRGTPLKVCIAVFHHSEVKATSIAFLNNHLDRNATFSTLVTDGDSTSKRDIYAVGEKGKGFTLATQFLQEDIESDAPRELKSNHGKPGVSFRVGFHVGELKWKRRGGYECSEVLRVYKDDLTPRNLRTMKEYLGIGYDEDSDSDDSSGDGEMSRSTHISDGALDKKANSKLQRDAKTRMRFRLSSKGEKIQSGSESTVTEVINVATDEVNIVALGRSGYLKPSEIFSGIFNIIPPEKTWRIEHTNVCFFIPRTEHHKLYLRDQIIPRPPSYLNRLGINFHGDLTIDNSRVSIYNDQKYTAFTREISRAAHAAFAKHPDLALEIAMDILTTKENRGLIYSSLEPGAIALMQYGKQYYDIFQKAFKIRYKETTQLDMEKPFYPISTLTEDDRSLIVELGYEPFMVPVRVVELLRESRGFLPIKQHAETLLLQSEEIAGDFAMFNRLTQGISKIILPILRKHGQKHLDIVVKQYRRSYPKILWDNGRFVLGLPGKCSVHSSTQKPNGLPSCLCHVGPYIYSAVNSFNSKYNRIGLVNPVELSIATVFRVHNEIMEGVVDMHEVEDEEDRPAGHSAEDPMDVDRDEGRRRATAGSNTTNSTASTTTTPKPPRNTTLRTPNNNGGPSNRQTSSMRTTTRERDDSQYSVTSNRTIPETRTGPAAATAATAATTPKPTPPPPPPPLSATNPSFHPELSDLFKQIDERYNAAVTRVSKCEDELKAANLQQKIEYDAVGKEKTELKEKLQASESNFDKMQEFFEKMRRRSGFGSVGGGSAASTPAREGNGEVEMTGNKRQRTE